MCFSSPRLCGVRNIVMGDGGHCGGQAGKGRPMTQDDEREAAGRDPGGSAGRKMLLYACGGASNVGGATDRAARELMRDGEAEMFCLAGIAAGVEEMVQAARAADLNVVIDGCPMDCAKKIFERANVSNYVHLRATDMGIVKVKSVPCPDEEVQIVVRTVRSAMDAAR